MTSKDELEKKFDKKFRVSMETDNGTMITDYKEAFKSFIFNDVVKLVMESVAIGVRDAPIETAGNSEKTRDEDVENIKNIAKEEWGIEIL